MIITSIKVKNFLSLTEVQVHPGKITQVFGNNGEGKTSFLKAIEFAAHGSNDTSLIKIGEDSAEVLLEFSDNTIVKRKVNSQGKQTVEVTREGMKSTSPQSFLDGLFDSNFFNPLELLDPKKRHEAIMNSIQLKIDAALLAKALNASESDLPPLDYSQHGLKVLDQCHKYFYQRRAEANKAAKEKKVRWETYKSDFVQMLPPINSRAEIKEVAEHLNDKQNALATKLHLVKRNQEAAQAAFDKIKKYTEEKSNIENKIAELKNLVMREEARLESAKKYISDLEKEIPVIQSTDELVAEQNKINDEIKNLTIIEKELDAYEENLKLKRTLDGMAEEFKAAESFAEAIDSRVTALAGPIKQDIMLSTEMPIEGLQYIDCEFFINGVALDNLSTASTMRLAVNIAKNISKKAKVICIDGVESLDTVTWEAFKNETQDDGFNYFVTKVGDPYPNGVFGSNIHMQKGQVIQ